MNPTSVVSVRRVAWFDQRYYAVVLGDGKKRLLPSVTTYLSASVNDHYARLRGDVGNEVMDRRVNEAADRGTRIHHACALYTGGGAILFEHPVWKNPDPELKDENAKVLATLQKEGREYFILNDQEEMLQVWRFQQWLEHVNPDVQAVEQIVYSLKHDFAGMLDYQFCIKGGTYPVAGSEPLRLAGGLYIVDLKSGQMNDDYYMQTAAYARAVEEMSGITVAGSLIISTNARTKGGIEGLQTYVRTADQVQADFEDFLHVTRIWKRKHPNDAPRILSFPSVLMKGQAPEGTPAKITPLHPVAEAEPTHDIDQEREKVLGEIEAMIHTVYQGESAEVTKGINSLVQRAWFRSGKSLIKSYKQIEKLSTEDLKQGLDQLRKDVQAVADFQKGKVVNE